MSLFLECCLGLMELSWLITMMCRSRLTWVSIYMQVALGLGLRVNLIKFPTWGFVCCIRFLEAELVNLEVQITQVSDINIMSYGYYP